MTPMTKLLRQEPSLYRRAVKETGDVNEAYMLVHTVMVRAFGHGVDPERDLDPAMTCALNKRSRALTAAQAAL
jgi:hypothetical protein